MQNIKIGLGTAWWGRIPRLQLLRRIDELFVACQALDINYVDTAHSYVSGLSEYLIRVGRLRHRTWTPRISTKVGHKMTGELAVEHLHEPPGTETMPKGDAVTPAIKRQAHRSMRRLGKGVVDTVLLHNPSPGYTRAESTWINWADFRRQTGVNRVGLSLDRTLSIDDFPPALDKFVIQVSAQQFVEKNQLFSKIAKTRDVEIVVNRIMGLGPDLESNFSLIASQELRPNIVLTGTTQVNRLEAAVDLIHEINRGML